jgi:hypothetical protein
VERLSSGVRRRTSVIRSIAGIIRVDGIDVVGAVTSTGWAELCFRFRDFVVV